MSDENNDVLVAIGAVAVVAIIAGSLAFGFSAVGGGGDTGPENTTSGEQMPADQPENLSDTGDSNDSGDNTDVIREDSDDSGRESDTGEDPNNRSEDPDTGEFSDDSGEDTDTDDGPDRTRASLQLSAETVNGATVERGTYTLYATPLRDPNKEVARYNLTQGSSHEFTNLTAGDRYTVEVDPAVFPAENFTIQAGQTEQFTAEVGYELRGADIYTSHYELTENNYNSNGEFTHSTDWVGDTWVDAEGNYRNAYLDENLVGDPSWNRIQRLTVAEENESYKNLGESLRTGWQETEYYYRPVASSDQTVQNGLTAYNRTHVGEVMRDRQLYHRYQTEIGTIDVDPQTGYIVYWDRNVSDNRKFETYEVWYSDHDEEDFTAIPEEFDSDRVGDQS